MEKLFRKLTKRQREIREELLVVQQSKSTLIERLSWLIKDPDQNWEKIHQYLKLISENNEEQAELAAEYNREQA